MKFFPFCVLLMCLLRTVKYKNVLPQYKHMEFLQMLISTPGVFYYRLIIRCLFCEKVFMSKELSKVHFKKEHSIKSPKYQEKL